VAAGVGLLVSGSPTLFAAVRYAGAAYLVYLGARLILATPDAAAGPEPLAGADAAFTATIVVVDILVMWFFFAAAAKGFRRFTRSARGQRVMNRLFGSLFIAVALLLALVH